MGIAGIQGSVNGVLVPDAYGPQWLNDDNVVFGQPSNGLIYAMNVDTSARQQTTPNGVHNDLRAGGNNWAAFLAGAGLIFAPNLHLPDAGLLDVGPDGAIGFRTLYHSNYGVEVFELSGERWPLNNTDIIYDLQLLGGKRAIWKDQQNHGIRTYNIPPCVQVGGAYRPRALFIHNEWWVCYWSTEAGLILHPFNSTIGYVIVPPGIDAFGHDAVVLGSTIKIVWSSTQGERPQDYRERFVEPAIDTRVELKPIVPVEPIVALNRPHWLGFFTGQPGVLGGWDTNDDPPEFRDVHLLPGNGYLDVPTSTFYNKRDEPVGSFIHSQPGWTVENIEEAARTSQFTPICYWDARNWPRWPNLPANSWLCLQAYCGRNEPFPTFEGDIRGKLIELSQIKPQQKIAIVAQAYWQTPVNTLTDNLSGLVPIFSRLAAEFPNVIATIPFNGNGRYNGMQNHPEIRPLWDQFAAGITGEPGMANPHLPGNVCEALHNERNKYPTPPSNSDLAQILNDTAWAVDQGADWGVSRKDFGAHCESDARPGLGKIAMDILHRRSDNLIWDVLIAAGEVSTVNCGEALGEMTDPRRPWVAPVKPPDAPDPTPLQVFIYYNDPVAKRSDPLGCLIKYEIASDRPVTRAEFFCEGNGENPVVVEFPVGPGFDGRYIRQIGVKFTVNGTWVLRVRGFDDQGREGLSDGSHQVEVTF